MDIYPSGKDSRSCFSFRKLMPTVTSVMWHPNPELRERWLREYGKDRFSFEEAREAQSFPESWSFPPQKAKRWKWLAEAFPPKVALYLFSKYVKGKDLILLDLFAGIGGWSLGAVWSGKFNKIIMVEKDPEKVSHLWENFRRLGAGFRIICGDARTIDCDFHVDVVASSPPCEDLCMLRFFSYNSINKGTVSLTLFTMDLVEKLRPKVAFYENVYRIQLKEALEKRGWETYRFDMSEIIPQKRIRLIAIKKFKGTP